MRRLALLLLILLAGCNLQIEESVTLVPSPTAVYVPPTPYRAPTLGAAPTAIIVPAPPVGAQGVVVTPTSGNLLTPVPAQTLIQNRSPSPTSQNVIEAFVNNLVVPAWNFIYTLILDGMSTMWLFAGARGGVFAQFFCCIAPVLGVIGVVLIRLRVIRLR